MLVPQLPLQYTRASHVCASVPVRSRARARVRARFTQWTLYVCGLRGIRACCARSVYMPCEVCVHVRVQMVRMHGLHGGYTQRCTRDFGAVARELGPQDSYCI